MSMPDNLEKDEQALLKKLEWEFSMIQTKIDNYGDIAYKIKGFIIPIASASIYFSWKEQNASIPIFGILAVMIFLYYETINSIHKNKLSERALFVEKALSCKALRRRFLHSNSMPYQVPCIARDLANTRVFSFKQFIKALCREWRSSLLYYSLLVLYLLLLLIFAISSKKCGYVYV